MEHRSSWIQQTYSSPDDQLREEGAWGLPRSATSTSLAWWPPADVALSSACSAAAIRSSGTAAACAVSADLSAPAFLVDEREESRQPPPTDSVMWPLPVDAACSISEASTTSIARCAMVLAP